MRFRTESGRRPCYQWQLYWSSSGVRQIVFEESKRNDVEEQKCFEENGANNKKSIDYPVA